MALAADHVAFDSFSVGLAIIRPIGVKIEFFSDVLKLEHELSALLAIDAFKLFANAQAFGVWGGMWGSQF